MKQFIETGKITAPFGIKGEVKVYPWSDSPEDITALSRLYVKGGSVEYAIERAYEHKGMVNVKLRGVDTVEDAEKLRNFVVYLNRDDKPLPEGVFFYADLLGLDIVNNDTGETVGTLSDITDNGASEIYTVKTPEYEFMMPVTPETLIKTDIENGKIFVHLLKGLLPDED